MNMSQLNKIIADLEDILNGKRMTEREYEIYHRLMQYFYTLDDMHQMFMAAEESKDNTLQ